jgi:probable F420-dependent oxidoreductase
VERLGFSHALVFDHVLGVSQKDRDPPLAVSYDETTPFHEPLVLLTFIAAVTTRLGLATGVLVLPQRQTALVGKQVAELDRLSGGRVRLGVGAGWNYVEYEALGAEFTRRGDVLAEQVALIRELWTLPLVDFDGRYHRVDRAALCPRPLRSIPLWLGGASDVALRRAAAMGDGFVFAPTTTDEFRRSIGTLRRYVSEAGRDPDLFPVERLERFSGARDAAEAVSAAVADRVRYLTVITTPTGGGLDEHIAQLESFMTAAQGVVDEA